MGKPSRDKGARFEREIVKIFQDHGIAAERVPLSGMQGKAGGKFKSDVVFPCLGRDAKLEAKKRANGDGFKSLYEWLDNNDAVVVGADRRVPLIVLPLDAYARLLAVAETAKLLDHSTALVAPLRIPEPA